MDNAEEETRLIHRFAEANGFIMKIGRTPDLWNIEIELCKQASDVVQPDIVMFTGYGSTKAEATKDLLKFIMLCNDWKDRSEMEVWCDLNCLSTCR